MTSNPIQSPREPDAGRGEGQRNPRLLDVFSVAELLDCSPRHVRRLSDSGRMPSPLGLGRLRRWNRAVIAAWIADGCPAVKRRNLR
ncbi:helix-turn-helix domain-containing protein [Candidatus Sumerlaeota bacterium]|nr:helix-turn-helix domain-containing protein [Candidatus Sumerlaeota bacterium]